MLFQAPVSRRRDNRIARFAQLALRVCQRRLPRRFSRFAKLTYSPSQLMSLLLLKAYLKQTYRGIVELIELSPPLQEALGLAQVPAHTTLMEFAKREASPALIAELTAELLELLAERGVKLDEVAVDSTGLSNSQASAHFVSRSGKKATHYTKLSVAVVCGALVAAAMTASLGPGNDLVEARPVLWQMSGNIHPQTLYADKGYDAEWVHELCRYGMQTRSYIPPVPKTRDGTVKTTLRSLMQDLPERYGRRWHAETYFSGLKRICGDKLLALSQPMREREALLKGLAYSIHR